MALSRIGSFGLVWIALACLAMLAWRRLVVPLETALAVVVADGLALGLKQVVGRERPYVAHPDPEPLMTTPLDLAFPSGHAATSFAGALVLTVAAPAPRRREAAVLFALAAAIASSRVYVGVHFPLDIVGGALLGLAVGAAFCRLVRVRPPARASEDAAP